MGIMADRHIDLAKCRILISNDDGIASPGIKVLAVARIVAAPFAAYQLAMHGADVIHVEHPDGGDPFRSFRGTSISGGGRGNNQKSGGFGTSLSAENVVPPPPSFSSAGTGSGSRGGDARAGAELGLGRPGGVEDGQSLELGKAVDR